MPVIPLELIDKYDAYVGRYVYLCGNENRERIDLRLVFRDGKEIGTDDLNLYYNRRDGLNVPRMNVRGIFFLLGVPVGRSGFTFQVLA